MSQELLVRPFEAKDQADVIALWERSGLVRAWNDPRKDIARKLRVQPELFLIGESGGALVATIMGGYEGHRGWVNYLAVEPACRRRGFGRTMMDEIEQRLHAVGCAKVNLAVRSENTGARSFYARLGYAADASALYGKRLEHDGPAPRAAADPRAALTLVVALHVDAACLDDFEAFEREASLVLGRYGGRIERRIRLRPGDSEVPHEVHVVTFPDADALARYRADPELAALSELRARAVRKTVIWVGDEAPSFGDPA